MRRLYDLAVNEGNVQAIKLLRDREWPAPNRYDRSNDELPLAVMRDYTGEHHEHCHERLIPSTVDDEPEATSESIVRAPEASTWTIQRPDDDERDTTVASPRNRYQPLG